MRAIHIVLEYFERNIRPEFGFMLDAVAYGSLSVVDRGFVLPADATKGKCGHFFLRNLNGRIQWSLRFPSSIWDLYVDNIWDNRCQVILCRC